MQETDLVMELLRRLEQKQCNGHAAVKLGRAIADPKKFRHIFTHFSQGTYFEDVTLDIEPVDPMISCRCGYRAAPRSAEAVFSCPACGEEPVLERGTEFEVLEP